jgi:hypothetical protein
LSCFVGLPGVLRDLIDFVLQEMGYSGVGKIYYCQKQQQSPDRYGRLSARAVIKAKEIGFPDVHTHGQDQTDYSQNKPGYQTGRGFVQCIAPFQLKVI